MLSLEKWPPPHDTNLYRLASRLADPERTTSSGLLLLAATPMQLHRFELYSLIELLDPALFADFDRSSRRMWTRSRA